MSHFILTLILAFSFNSALAQNPTCINLFSDQAVLRAEDIAKLEVSAMDYFVTHLRLPPTKYLAESNKMSEKWVNELIPDYEVFWDNAILNNSKKMNDARSLLTSAYNTFLVELKKGGITPRSATAEEIFATLVESHSTLKKEAFEGTFQLKHVLRLLGLRPRAAGRVPYPVLFSGLEGLRVGTKERFPNSFKGLRDSRYAKAYHEQIMKDLINKYNGGVAISFRGVPWEQGKLYFTAIAEMAKERNLLILVKEVNGDPDSIPPEILNHPQVRLVSRTIDLGPELRIWGSMMIIPTNKEPLAGLRSKMARVPRGQKQIVFSTQRALGVVATDKNLITGAHEVWSTGTLNDPIYPYSNLRSSRVSDLAAERDIMGAVVFEKSDRASGPLNRGAPGRWHISNYDYQPKTESSTVPVLWGDGAVYGTRFYPADGAPSKFIHPLGLVPGDIHLGFELQSMLAAINKEFFVPALQNGGKVIHMRLHDFLSHEEISKYLTPAQKASMYEDGILSLRAVHNFARGTINDIIEKYPNIRIVLSKEDNHHAWLYKSLNDHAQLDDPVNGPYLKQLAAKQTEGHDLLEWIFKDQESYDAAIPNIAKRNATMAKNVYVHEPDKVIILSRGDTYDIGPPGATWNLAQHGHMASRGAKGGSNMEPHAIGNDRATIDHTHEKAIVGYAFNSGMAVRLGSQEYAKGSYSGQGNAMTVISENGSGQLAGFDPVIGAFFPNPEVGTLRGRAFYTKDPFVVEDPNDLVGPEYTPFNNYENSKSPSTPLLPD